MNEAKFSKTIISCAILATLGLAGGSATADPIAKIKIEDVGSNTANGAGAYTGALDGISGAFQFKNNYINVSSYNGATPWTGDVGDMLGGGSANATGSFSTGFLFSGSPFVPYTYGSGFQGVIDIDMAGNYSMAITSLDFGGNYNSGANFNLPPDSNFPVEVLWLKATGNGDFDAAFRWGHDINSAEDPSLAFTAFTAQWVLEGTANVVDDKPTIYKNSGVSVIDAGTPYVDPGAVCADVVDGLISGNIMTAYDPLTTDPNNPQADFNVLYNCQDSTGHDADEVARAITVSSLPDVIPPVVTLNGCTTAAGINCSQDGSANSNTVDVLVGANYVDALGTCNDDRDGDILLSGTGPGATDPTFFSNPADPNNPPFDTSTPTSATIDFTCRDTASNETTVSRTVNVVADNIAPVIDLGSQLPHVVLGLDSTPPNLAQGINCTDTNQVDGPGSVTDITPNLALNPTSVDTSVVGSTQVTYSCTDAAGNNATQVIRTFDVAAGQNFRILSMTVSDFNGDGLAGCFAFSDINPNTCTGANRFSSDGIVDDPFAGTTNATIAGKGTDLDQNDNPIGIKFGEFQNPGQITPGFLFAGSPFVPFTFDPPSTTATVPEGFVIDTGSGHLVKFNSFPFSGRYTSLTPNDFYLPPDQGTLNIIEVNPVAGPPAIPGTLEFQYRIAWSHIITLAEDPTAKFDGNNARFLLEGVITTEDTPTVLNDAPVINGMNASNINFSSTRIVPRGDGMVTVTVDATDPNPGDTLSYQWTGPAGITGQTGPSVMFDPSTLEPGNISIGVTVTDDASEPLSASDSLVLQIVDTPPDADYGDDDTDLIPNYLDGVDGTISPGINNVSPGSTQQIVVENGQLVLGQFAFGTGSGSFLVTEADIGVQDRVNRVDGLGHSGGGLYDLEIHGLPTGGTARFVLPQAVPIPDIAEYRMYSVNRGWFPFESSGGNALASAMSVAGICPPPDNDVAYDDSDGLQGGMDCVRVTIVDGTAMDGDSTANGRVVDPGTVSNNGFATQGNGISGGCSMVTNPSAGAVKRADWWLLAALTACLGIFRRRTGKKPAKS